MVLIHIESSFEHLNSRKLYDNPIKNNPNCKSYRRVDEYLAVVLPLIHTLALHRYYTGLGKLTGSEIKNKI